MHLGFFLYYVYNMLVANRLCVICWNMPKGRGALKMDCRTVHCLLIMSKKFVIMLLCNELQMLIVLKLRQCLSKKTLFSRQLTPKNGLFSWI